MLMQVDRDEYDRIGKRIGKRYCINAKRICPCICANSIHYWRNHAHDSNGARVQSRCEMRGTVLTKYQRNVRMQTNMQCTTTAATVTEFSKCKVYKSAKPDDEVLT